MAGIRLNMVYRTAVQNRYIYICVYHNNKTKNKIKDVQQNENIIHEAHYCMYKKMKSKQEKLHKGMLCNKYKANKMS